MSCLLFWWLGVLVLPLGIVAGRLLRNRRRDEQAAGLLEYEEEQELLRRKFLDVAARSADWRRP